eukprot:scaffold60421_cov75-Phaeocystis_antarctica.AAC.1
MRTVGGPAITRRRSELANLRRRCHRQSPSGWHLRRRFANFQRQRAPAGPPIGVFRANAPLSVNTNGHFPRSKAGRGTLPVAPEAEDITSSRRAAHIILQVIPSVVPVTFAFIMIRLSL